MPRAALIAALACALAAGGCDRSEVHRVQGSTVALELDEYSVTPQRIRARAGKLTITVRNVGRLNHNINVRRGEKKLIASMQSIRAGQTGRITFDARAGGYTLFCSVSRHEDLGEYAALTVAPSR